MSCCFYICEYTVCPVKMSDPVAERRALVARMEKESLASSGSSSQPQPQATAVAPVALLPAIDPRRAVGPAEVQRIAQACSQPEPSLQTPDGLAMLAHTQQQQQQLQLALLQQSQQPMWRQILPYFAMGLATVGTFMFLRWCFGGSPALSGSSMTPEQQQVMRFAQQNVLSGNDEAMQALAVLARQFKA